MTAVYASPVVERLEVAWLDPRELASHPRNVRTNLGDLTGLTASVREQGVLEPLIVVPLDDGKHQLVAGERRKAAAITAELELVPCIVRRDLAGLDNAALAEHVASMLAENLHRDGLTPMEEARGIKQMLDLGVPISKVAKRTGLGQKRVKLSIGVSRLDAETAAAVDTAQLDLDQAAAVALFADEPEVAAQLVAAAEHGPGNFAHAVTRARQDRDTARQVEEKRAELVAAGRGVVDAAHWQGTSDRSIDSLADSAGEHLTAKSHADCPGSAVYVSSHTAAVTYVCRDPGKYGHRGRWDSDKAIAPDEKTPEQAEAEKAERRKVIENNKAMAAANATRREWIKDYLARRTAPKGVLRFAVEEIAANPGALHRWLGSESPVGDKDADVAMGLQTPVLPWSMGATEKRVTLTSGEQVPDARLPLQLLAHVAGAIESGIAKDSWRKGNYRETDLVRWLRFLAGQGYTLSDVEQTVVDKAAKT